jgi:hypothetical protein
VGDGSRVTIGGDGVEEIVICVGVGVVDGISTITGVGAVGNSRKSHPESNSRINMTVRVIS